MGKEKTENQNLARELYLNTNKSQKEIAEICGVTQKTIGDWKVDYGWDDLKAAKSVTRSEIVKNYYQAILTIQDEIKMRDIPIPTSKDADILAKIHNNIAKLESKSVSLAEMIEFGEKFLRYLQEFSPNDMQVVSSLLYGFYSRLNKELD